MLCPQCSNDSVEADFHLKGGTVLDSILRTGSMIDLRQPLRVVAFIDEDSIKIEVSDIHCTLCIWSIAPEAEIDVEFV